MRNYAIESGLMHNPALYYKTESINKDQTIEHLQKQLEEAIEVANQWMHYSQELQERFQKNHQEWELYVQQLTIQTPKPKKLIPLFLQQKKEKQNSNSSEQKNE